MLGVVLMQTSCRSTVRNILWNLEAYIFRRSFDTPVHDPRWQVTVYATANKSKKLSERVALARAAQNISYTCMMGIV